MTICRYCPTPAQAHALCPMHYARLRRHGDPLYERPYHRTCTVDGCDRATVGGRTMCEMHRSRAWRRGLPTGRRQEARR